MKTSDKPLSDMLADGDLPAMISPTLPRPFVEGDKRIARLFADYKQIEIDYFRQTGIFPIMHVTTIKREIVEKYPWVADQPRQGVRAGKADRLSARRQPAHDPARLGAHRGRGAGAILGRDPWAYGLTPANRKNLETVLRYTHQQGLIRTMPKLDDLFEDTDLGDAAGSEEF